MDILNIHALTIDPINIFVLYCLWLLFNKINDIKTEFALHSVADDRRHIENTVKLNKLLNKE